MSSTHLAPNDEVPIIGALAVSLGSQTVAFPLDDVIEVLSAMAVEPLPSAPAVVVGMINLRGSPLPVLDLRVRLGLPEREADPDDRVVVCRLGERQMGIWVDRAVGVHLLGTEVAGLRPSVAVLFNSPAIGLGADAIAVVLTGMGRMVSTARVPCVRRVAASLRRTRRHPRFTACQASSSVPGSHIFRDQSKS